MKTIEIMLSNINMPGIVDILKYDASNPLLFNSGLFLILFLLFIIVYNLLAGRTRLRMVFVILFSLYFYYKSSAWSCLILLGVCISDYVLGRLLYRAANSFVRKSIVAFNVIANVGMLVYFKYFDMIADTLREFVSLDIHASDVILPVGISFFTFRSISYIVDIYRGELHPSSNFIDYCFFLTFFPPLLAGPVVRAKDMLPQVYARPQATNAQISKGLAFIMFGLVKKIIVADYLSGNFVDRIFDNPALYSGFENLMGCIGFTIQLYCDFSGYSDMAIGLALLLGFEFNLNFNAPFKARNPSDFWRRWHISLSTWLRDYIYIPLGGNRKGRGRTYVNNFLTMVIGGLWHGASWMYVVWGAYHGALLALHKAFRHLSPLPRTVRATWFVGVVNVGVTFALVVFGFVIFRSPSMDNLSEMIHQIIFDFHPGVAGQFIGSYMMIVILMIGALVIHYVPASYTDRVIAWYGGNSIVVKSIVLAAVLFAVIQSRQSDLVPFVYLQY